MDQQDWNPWGHKDQKDYYAAVGYLCNQWNIAEWFYYRLATDMLRLGRENHDILFRHLGIVAISQFMNEYASTHIKSQPTRDQLKFVSQYVDNCRINRNAIVHGIATYRSESLVEIISQADQRRAKARLFPVNLKQLRKCCDECGEAGNLAIRMQYLLAKSGIKSAKLTFGKRWRSVLYVRPALPKILVAEHLQTPAKPQRLPRPSRASRRKPA